MKNFNVSMKKLFILLLYICSNTIAQVPITVAPLAINNHWVYEEYDDIFHSNLLRTTRIKVTDTLYIDSIKYFEISINDIPGFISNRSIRLREDEYYVMRKDSTFPMPDHEEIYYKKNALYFVWR